MGLDGQKLYLVTRWNSTAGPLQLGYPDFFLSNLGCSSMSHSDPHLSLTNNWRQREPKISSAESSKQVLLLIFFYLHF
jgi:hypothetical protein